MIVHKLQMSKMFTNRKYKLFVGFMLLAACACVADPVADYCREVVEPAIAGVFAAKWTPRGPDAESVAAACTNVDWRIVR